MTTTTLSAQMLTALEAYDTPTICNALEHIAPERRGYGFTRAQLNCVRSTRKPIVGLARTATIRADAPTNVPAADSAARRSEYYGYVADGDLPRVVVMQDLDPTPGVGAFWGEVNSNIHKGLGCLGVVTNGSVRDLDDLADEFQAIAGVIGPSHCFVHVVDFATQVNVHGMVVEHDDVIHADLHGAVVIPWDAVAKIPDTVDLLVRREKVILDAARAPDFDIHKLREAMSKQTEIH